VFDDATNEWYLANFSPAQPELDWSNPAVRDAMREVVRFWVDRDVDGFRIDMVDFLGKDPELRDEEPGSDLHPRERLMRARHQLNRPETLDYLTELRAAVNRGRERVLVGEVIYYLPIDRLVEWGRPGRLELPTNFRLTYLDFSAATLGSFVAEYDSALRAANGWPNYCLGNHDSPRFTRLGGKAKAAMVILMTLRGTPFLYYGDEIGMAAVDIAPADTKDLWQDASYARDAYRTPMQWSDTPGVGFTDPHVKPWLPAGSTGNRLSVDQQRGVPGSMLELTRTLISLRRHVPALSEGELSIVSDVPEQVLAYLRHHDSGDVLVVANLGEDSAAVHAPASTELLSTHPATTPEGADLAPGEARVIQLAHDPRRNQ
jgi:alpha-glucosidase